MYLGWVQLNGGYGLYRGKKGYNIDWIINNMFSKTKPHQPSSKKEKKIYFELNFIIAIWVIPNDISMMVDPNVKLN